MNLISSNYYRFEQLATPARQMAELVALTQHESFFHLAHAKQARVDRLRAHFASHPVRKIWFSGCLAAFDCHIDGVEVGFLPRDFFLDPNLAEDAAKRAMLEDTIVIANNNDLASQQVPNPFATLYGESERTIFVTWDWDNHHWLDLSTFLAAHSDIYAPAHHENLYLLSRYNWLSCGPVYCASVQWPHAYLADQLGAMLSVARSDAPLGMHIPYAQFAFRMRVVSTLTRQFPTIGFSDSKFHDRTRDDRLQEWMAHKLHWIVPVLNDVPIRIFDALATGGIPVVPESMRLLPSVGAIPREHILFYGPSDIIDPSALVARGNALFDAGGRDQIAARHRYALAEQHGQTRVRQMLGAVREVFGIDLARR